MENLLLMKAIDELYTKYPFYGARRIAVNLPNIFQPINVKKVRRLMKLMGIEAIYPKANLSKPDSEHKIFPYLLRDLNTRHKWVYLSPKAYFWASEFQKDTPNARCRARAKKANRSPF